MPLCLRILLSSFASCVYSRRVQGVTEPFISCRQSDCALYEAVIAMPSASTQKNNLRLANIIEKILTIIT